MTQTRLMALAGYRKGTPARMLAAGICSLGGVIYGYDLGTISAAAQSLREHFFLSAAKFGITISISLWGAVCGALIAGRLIDSMGRRGFLGGCALLYALATAAVALPFATNWILFLTLRFVSGVTIAGFSVCCPLYLAEIAPDALRGRFVGLFQLQIGIGVVIAFATGSWLAHAQLGGIYWKQCLGLGAIPAIVFLLLLPCMPPSPVSRASGRQQQKQAYGAARRLRSSDAEWQNSSGRGSEVNLHSEPETLFQRKYLRPILLATSIAIFNQFTGVNLLLLYLLDILSGAGFGRLLGHTYTVFLSCLNFVTTLLSMICADKLGRRPLLLAGSAGMSLCLLILGFTSPGHAPPLWYLVILVAYNGFFAFSQGPIVWIYLSELFPLSVRASGQGYGTLVLWIANATLVLIFPALRHVSSEWSFYLLAIMMLLQIPVVLFWYPETKGTVPGAAVAAMKVDRDEVI